MNFYKNWRSHKIKHQIIIIIIIESKLNEIFGGFSVTFGLRNFPREEGR